VSDLLLNLSYLAYLLISFLTDDGYLVVSFRASIIVLSFIKLNFYLRLFHQLSFLVQMIQAVIHDLRHFLLFFAIFILAFALLLSILVDIDSETYDTEVIGIVVPYFIMAFRTSIGDYNLSDYTGSGSFKVINWIVWLAVMLIGNVIFMNFIIAVVNESYEKCMSKVMAESFKVKVDMILERESLMSQDDFSNPAWYPRFLITRRAVDGEGEGENQEWQGFVKEIKSNNER